MLTNNDYFGILITGKERKNFQMNILKKYMNDVIHKKGFEDDETIEFCTLCEECEKNIIPFEFVQKVYYRIIRG